MANLVRQEFCSEPSLPHNSHNLVPPPDLHPNLHKPLIIESPTIKYIDLDNQTSADHKDRVLILTPLKDAAAHLEQHFELLSQLTYPHAAIDLAFLVSDSSDGTLSVLNRQLEYLQNESNPKHFRNALVIEKDFGVTLGQSVEERHSFKAQGVRRKAIGRARNYLLYTALKPDHQWVYWRDVDIVENPESILEDFIRHDKDILVPSIPRSTKLDNVSTNYLQRYLVSSIR